MPWASAPRVKRWPPRCGRSSSTRTTETRNTCTYCAVACGILIYSLGDRAKNASASIIHIEGDPDHPVNRGTLCPKGAALLDFVHAPTPGEIPDGTARPARTSSSASPGTTRSDRIARLMKEDRDKNFIAKNAAGTTVQPLDHYRHAGGVRNLQRDRAS